MGSGPSKAQLEKVRIQTATTYKGVEIEWAAKKEIELAKVKLGEKTVELENAFKMEKTTNDKIKNTLHVQTQSEIISKLLEHGFSSDDYCMAAGLSYLTLKDDLAKEEMEALKNTMMSAMKNKTKATKIAHHYNGSDTGCETDEEASDNQIAVATMT